MRAFFLLFIGLFTTLPFFGQEVTESVKKQHEMGYPIRVLEELPMVKGCESLAVNKTYLAQCLKDQLNFLFASSMKDVKTYSSDKRGVSIYVEFIIDEHGQVSAPIRVKVSEQTLDAYVRQRFERFRGKVNAENLIVSPGVVHDKKVNTLYGVKFVKSFKQ